MHDLGWIGSTEYHSLSETTNGNSALPISVSCPTFWHMFWNDRLYLRVAVGGSSLSVCHWLLGGFPDWFGHGGSLVSPVEGHRSRARREMESCLVHSAVW